MIPTGEFVTIAIALGTLMVIIIGLIFRFLCVESNKRKDIYKTIENNKKRLYERVDEIKSSSKQEYVAKEICHILHIQMKESLDEIKVDVKSLLRKNGIETPK